MDSHDYGQSVPPMNAVTLAQALDRRERAKLIPASDARRALARRLRVGLGTFQNLVRGRVKSCDAAIRDKLQALLIRELEQEIARLQNELEIARQGGIHPASQHIGEIETHLAAIHALMAGGVRG